MSRKSFLKHKTRVSHQPKPKNALAERYRRRRINLWHKIVDLHDMFGVRSYTVLKDDKNTWELNSDPTRPGWPSMASGSSAEHEEDEEEAGEDEGEENEVEEEEQEEAEETPNNHDDEDREEVEDVAEGVAYQPMELAEAAAEAVVAQIDHSIEERVARIDYQHEDASGLLPVVQGQHYIGLAGRLN